MIQFLLGVIIGSILTVVILSCCAISKVEEEREREMYERWKEEHNKGEEK